MKHERTEMEIFQELLLYDSKKEDAWWLDDWLKQRIRSLIDSARCPDCNSLAREDKPIYSKAGNYILERLSICAFCGCILMRTDYRASLRETIKAGDVRVKDLEILKSETFDELKT